MSDWPCNLAVLDSAKAFVRDAASKGGKVVLAPDRDADGLCAGKMLCPNLVLALTDHLVKAPNLHALCIHLSEHQTGRHRYVVIFVISNLGKNISLHTHMDVKQYAKAGTYTPAHILATQTQCREPAS